MTKLTELMNVIAFNKPSLEPDELSRMFYLALDLNKTMLTR